MTGSPEIVWIRKRKFYSPYELGGLIAIAVAEGGAASHAEGDIMASPTDVTVQQNEIGAFGIVGVTFAVGDLFHGLIDIPRDLDARYEIGIRVNWNNSAAATTTRAVTWIVLADIVLSGGVFAIATTALDTIIATSLVTAALANEWSPRGIIDAGSHSLTQTQVEDGAKLEIRLEADILTDTPANIRFLGIEIDYTPRLHIGIDPDVQGPLAAGKLL